MSFAVACTLHQLSLAVGSRAHVAAALAGLALLFMSESAGAGEACTATGTIRCGESVTASLGANDVHCFPFDARRDEVVSVRVAAAAGAPGAFAPCWRIVGPTPASSSQTSCQPGEITLTEDGGYTLEVLEYGNDAAGTYHLTLNAVSETFNGLATCGTPITCGKTRSGAIPHEGAAGTWTFAAQRGEQVSVSVAMTTDGGGFLAVWQLFSPSGELLRATHGEAVSGILPETGRYTIQVHDNRGDRTGTYDVNLAAVSGTLDGAPVCAQPVLSCGEPVAHGTFASSADTSVYAFSGHAGELISIATEALVVAPFFEPCWRIVGPGGVVDDIRCGQGSVLLTGDGTHHVLVIENGQDATGPYRLSFGAPDCPLPDVPSAAGETSCGNCRDDDGDGLIDAEDPDCCVRAARLDVRRVVVRRGPGVGGGHLKLVTLFSPPSPVVATPGRDGLSVVLRNANGGVFCAAVDGDSFTRRARRLVFAAPRGTPPGGLAREVLRLRHDRAVKVKLIGGGPEPARYVGTPLVISVASGGTCATTAVPLHAGRRGLVFP